MSKEVSCYSPKCVMDVLHLSMLAVQEERRRTGRLLARAQKLSVACHQLPVCRCRTVAYISDVPVLLSLPGR